MTEKHWERINFGNMYTKKWILYISLNTDFGVFYKKDARRKMTKIGPKMRRDLSHETDSGPKTETVETLHLAYHFLSSYLIIPQPAYFLSSYFIHSMHPVRAFRHLVSF